MTKYSVDLGPINSPYKYCRYCFRPFDEGTFHIFCYGELFYARNKMEIVKPFPHPEITMDLEIRKKIIAVCKHCSEKESHPLHYYESICVLFPDSSGLR